ncbi:hypothetical protein KUTeg_001746 [Tegillarca granosa]|uniref:G-protein coupled receptors family 1 profile domain-containing protein n=1 Tax=Tegillarca granosa TaxID=220873 RepID=A0ABQ9FSB8_TEGGR|nr:hypothetical protein KUTeg_001746 [Tegillarca granosa]
MDVVANSSEMNKSTTSQNNTTTTGYDAEDISKYNNFETAAFIITWVETVLILLFNGLLIIGILRKPERNRLTFFVLQLSISDFGIGLMYLLPDAIQRTSVGWIAGLNMCRFYQYMSHVMAYVSSYMLVVISLDRLLVVLQPLKHTGRGKLYKYTLPITAWMVSMLLAIPQPMNTLIYDNSVKTVCDLMYESNVKFYLVFFVCAAVAVPAVLIFVCYAMLVRLIWLRMNSGMKVSKRQRTGRSSKTIFVISWSPLCINLLLIVFNVIKQQPVYYVLMALAPINSVADPIVFMAFNYKVLSPQYLRRSSTSATNHTMISKGVCVN